MLKSYLLPGESLPGVFKDYLENLPQAVRFLGEHYSVDGVFAKKADAVCSGYAGDRKRLVDMLLTYNRILGCSPQSEVQLNKLREQNAVAVLCGQQAGLLSGPLYTVYKAAMAVKLAARLEKELSRPVVPVFWIAAEDHDFSEANHCYVLDQDSSPQRLQLELEHEGQPVGRLKLTDEAGQAVLDGLTQYVPQTEFTADVLSWLQQAREGSETPAEWFGRIMTRLFAEQGLVIFNPLLPEARKLAAPIFQKAVQKREEIQVALASREAGLRAEGYRLQVEREEDAGFLMLMEPRRTALYFRKGRYTVRDESITHSEEELLQLAKNAPEMLSPNVLLRPLVQDYIFPTVAFIPGPGETAYFAQGTSLYPVFEVEQPVLVPRAGLTLVEPRLARYIKKYGIRERELLRGLDESLEQELKRKNELDIDRVFDHLRSHLALEYDHLKRELGRLNPQLNTLADKNLQHVYGQVRYLEDKAREEYRKKNEVMIRHFTHLEQTLKPLGKLQERVFCILPFLLKYGPSFWEKLLEDFPEQPGHYLYYL
jgi:bacillithiol biosynthesis cysteine-adding enzyme BshC